MTIINNQIIDTTLFISLNNIKTKNSMIPGFHDDIQRSIKKDEEDVYHLDLEKISLLPNA